MPTAIKEATTGAVLARSDSDALRFEGNFYFAPGDVSADVLKLTDRTYTCPYKGTCNWVDFVAADGRVVKDVAWVYPTPKPGHEQIAGRYGFYSGRRAGTVEESS